MSTTEHDWQRVVDELQPRGYCEIQDHEAGLVYHGPVESIQVDEMDFVHIHFKWIAKMGTPGKAGFGKWVKAEDKNKEQVFPNLIVPFVVESTPEKGDRIRFNFNIIYLLPDEENNARILAEIS